MYGKLEGCRATSEILKGRKKVIDGLRLVRHAVSYKKRRKC